MRSRPTLERAIERYGFALLLLAAGLFAFLPFYWAITISIRDPQDTFTVTGLAVPFAQFRPTLVSWAQELAVGEAQRAITNSIVSDSVYGAGIAAQFADGATVTGCNLWNNQGGDAVPGIDGGCNFSADPIYCNAAEGNYHIEASSPCAGVPASKSG